MRNFKSKLKQFAANTGGNIGIMLALSAIPMIAGVGAALDFGHYLNVNTELAAALDAASLAGATASGTDAQKIKIANDVFDQNFKTVSGGLKATTAFTINNGVFNGEVTAPMPMMLMGLMGVPSLDAVARNQVGLPAAKKAEVALVLDYSGSMGDVAGSQVKYKAMGKAATKLIDDLTVNNPSKVKFSLVPFSQHVYVSLPAQYVKGGGSGTWTSCTQDRLYPYNLSDAAPNAADDTTKWGQPNVVHPWKSSCADYASKSLVVRPLTNDFSGLKTQIAAMTPYQNTHIPLGVEFGYQTLSPNGAFTGAAQYSDKTTSKFLVLLTDGTQTEPAWGPSGMRTVVQGDTNLENLCSNVKASGITVVTIAYDLSDSTQRQRLQNCASDPATDFFVANTDADVAKAFQAITNAVQQTVYLSK